MPLQVMPPVWEHRRELNQGNCKLSTREHLTRQQSRAGARGLDGMVIPLCPLQKEAPLLLRSARYSGTAVPGTARALRHSQGSTASLGHPLCTETRPPNGSKTRVASWGLFLNSQQASAKSREYV